MDQTELIERYRQTVLETGKPPSSVYIFSRDLGIGEREFFEQFGSFESLESEIWAKLVKDTIAAVESGEEWPGFNAQQKMLSFLYAFCDRILDHRSFFLERFPRRQGRQVSGRLSAMRLAYSPFAERVIETGIERGELARRGALARAYPMGFFGHFLSVIEFNLSDSSRGFERTDAYIEKSVRLAFDVVGTQAFDSAFDLFRFLSGRSWRHSRDQP